MACLAVRVAIPFLLALVCWVGVTVAAATQSVTDRFIFLDKIPPMALTVEDLSVPIVGKPWTDSEKAKVLEEIRAVEVLAPGLVERVVGYRAVRLFRTKSATGAYAVSLRKIQGLLIPDKFFKTKPSGAKLNWQRLAITHEFVHLAEPSGWLESSSQWLVLCDPYIKAMKNKLKSKGLSIHDVTWGKGKLDPRKSKKKVDYTKLALSVGLPTAYAASAPGEAMAEFLAHDLVNPYYKMPQAIRPFLEKHLTSKPFTKDAYVAELQSAFAARERGNLGETFAAFSRALAQSKDDLMEARVLAYRGDTYRLYRQYNKAVEDYTSGIKLNPSARFLHRYRGMAFLALGKPDQAIADFTIYIDHKQDDQHGMGYTAALVSRGKAWQKKKMPAEAVKDYTRALEIWPGNTEALGRRGTAWRELGKYDKAISDLTRTLKIQPQPIGYYERAQSWYSLRKPKKALADLNEALRLNPKFLYAYLARGHLYYTTRHYAKAEADYGAVLRAAPQLWLIYLRRGKARYMGKNYDGAIADFSVTIKKTKPGRAKVVAYAWRSAAWQAKGQGDKAITDMNQVLKLAPGQVTYHVKRGDLWAKKKAYKKAIADYSAALKKLPKDIGLYAKRASLSVRAQDYDGAIAGLTTAISRTKPGPRQARLYFWRGVAHKKKGQLGKALADLNRAIAYSPNHMVSYGYRGDILFSRGEYGHAIRDYEAVLRLSPRNAQALFMRGRCWQAKGNKTKAIADYRQAIKLSSTIKPRVEPWLKKAEGR